MPIRRPGIRAVHGEFFERELEVVVDVGTEEGVEQVPQCVGTNVHAGGTPVAPPVEEHAIGQGTRPGLLLLGHSALGAVRPVPVRPEHSMTLDLAGDATNGGQQ